MIVSMVCYMKKVQVASRLWHISDMMQLQTYFLYLQRTKVKQKDNVTVNRVK